MKSITCPIILSALILFTTHCALAELWNIGTALYDDGSGQKAYALIYDTDQQVTFLDYTRNIDSWQNQKLWAEGLNLTVHLKPGYSSTNNWQMGWRLPVVDNPEIYSADRLLYGPNDSGHFDSELGRLFYASLNNIARSTFPNNYYDHFVNISPDVQTYWTGSVLPLDSGVPDGTWSFKLYDGEQLTGNSVNDNLLAIAIHVGIVEFNKPPMLGDVNQDEQLDLMDIILSLKAMAGQNTLEISTLGDVNGDGLIGLPDTIFLTSYNSASVCNSTAPINIISIQAEEAVPFAPVNIILDPITSIIPNRSSIIYNGMSVPILEVDYDNNSVLSHLPNLPGVNQISISSPCTTHSNSVPLIIGDLTLPAGTTVDGVLTDTFTQLDSYLNDLNVEATNPNTSPKLQDAYAKISDEFEAFSIFLDFLLNEDGTPEDRLESASLISYLTEHQSGKSPQNLTILESAITEDAFVDFLEWKSVDLSRNLLATGELLSAISDWGGLASYLTLGGPGKALDTALTVMKLFLSSMGKNPVVLDNVYIDIRYNNTIGIYRDDNKHELICSGDFVPYIKFFSKELLSILTSSFTNIIGVKFAKNDPRLINLQNYLLLAGLARNKTIVGEAVGQTLDNGGSAIIPDSLINEITNNFNAISNALESDLGVIFPCGGANHLTAGLYIQPGYIKIKKFKSQNEHSWVQGDQRIGVKTLSGSFYDSLNNGNAATAISIGVLNNEPEIVGPTPECQLEPNGSCTFTITFNDKDNEGRPKRLDSLFLDEGPNMPNGNITITQLTEDSFEIDFSTTEFSQQPLSLAISDGFNESQLYSTTIIEIPIGLCSYWVGGTTDGNIFDSGTKECITPLQGGSTRSHVSYFDGAGIDYGEKYVEEGFYEYDNTGANVSWESVHMGTKLDGLEVMYYWGINEGYTLHNYLGASDYCTPGNEYIVGGTTPGGESIQYPPQKEIIIDDEGTTVLVDDCSDAQTLKNWIIQKLPSKFNDFNRSCHLWWDHFDTTGEWEGRWLQCIDPFE